MAAYYSLVDKDGAFTLANFAALVNDVTLRKPFLLAIGMACGVGALSCAIATPLAWLVSRTDLPGRRVVRALVTASFVTPPFLGAIAWEILAAPNSGLVNVAYRSLTGGQPYDAPLVNIYTLQGLIFAIACYTFPYVFTLVANGLDRVPSDLEDASAILGAPPRNDAAARDHPAGVAGDAGRLADRHPAGPHDVRLARHPGVARRLSRR